MNLDQVKSEILISIGYPIGKWGPFTGSPHCIHLFCLASLCAFCLASILSNRFKPGSTYLYVSMLRAACRVQRGGKAPRSSWLAWNTHHFTQFPAQYPIHQDFNLSVSSPKRGNSPDRPLVDICAYSSPLSINFHSPRSDANHPSRCAFTASASAISDCNSDWEGSKDPSYRPSARMRLKRESNRSLSRG